MGLYQRRQGVVGSCPYGGFFQSCATGFKGCCLVDACTDGCPAGKDRTEKSAESADTSRGSISSSTENSNPSSTATVDETPSSATAATSSSSSSSSSPSSSSPSSSSPSSSSPSSLSPTATVSWTAEHVITSLSGGPTAHVVIDNQPIPSSTPSNMVAEQPAHGNHALPVAAIVGGSLGGFIALIALASVVCICLKMKKHKIYRSPEYPSPLIGSDMSEQLRGDRATESKGAEFTVDQASPGAGQLCTPQLDSREVERYEAVCASPESLYAELPGEPLPWPGQSGSGSSV